MHEQTIGPYRVLRPLALGGMGETLLAENAQGERIVIKRLLPHLAGDVEAERCFREERRIASRLDHPNIVKFVEASEHAGQPLLIVEYVDGCSARDLLAHARQNNDPIAVADACAVVEAAARGLHCAHCLADEQGNPLGLIHRDVSPANILIGVDGEVKVIDFGVAKAWDAEGRTATGVVKGKIGYMSPEHALCEPLDARADVFALGIVLWELLVGDRLFISDSPMATAYQVLEAPIPKPSSRRPEIPARVDAICMNALERDRSRRVESAGALERSLAAWRVETGVNPQLAQLVRARFPSGLPGATEARATQLARSRSGAAAAGAGDVATTVEGGGPRAVPLRPGEPAVPSIELAMPDTQLLSTRIDSGIAPSMRALRRHSLLRRFAVAGVGLALAAIAGLAIWLWPPGVAFDAAPGADTSAPVYFSYVDARGTIVIVSSLSDVPLEQRPAARRLDLEHAPLTIETADPEHRSALERELQQLRRRLQVGGPRPHNALGVLRGLLLPIAALLLGAALAMWLIGHLRDRFVRWTLRLLVVFVFGVAIARTLMLGFLDAPGLSSLKIAPPAISIDELSPGLRQGLQQMLGGVREE
ncbi:MAG: serine/threonine protein kinase [Deltaproteobacteria bacterium]|nr:serine/threonine protein kinase [Deltaproteobacteria bacterium]